jgi:DNA-binding MarR family transcriptional regulator
MLSMARQPTVPKRQHAVNRHDVTTSPGAGDALSELVVHVFRLDGLFKSAGDLLAAPAGQTTARWRILAAVDGGPLTVADIARAWWLSRQSVQRVADVLADEGFVTYEANPAHRRAQLVRLTPRGRTALTRIRAAQRGWAETVGNGIDIEDVRTANRVLARVIETLDRAT